MTTKLMATGLMVGSVSMLLLGCGVEPGGPSGESAEPIELAAVQATPPAVLQAFATMVRTASNNARAAGSKGCGVAITPVQVTDATIDKAIKTFVINYRGVQVNSQPQPACGKPGLPVCANLFQNILFHNDARMGTALHPSAQAVDSMAISRRVNLFSSASPVVATNAGIYNGWLMGVTWFDQQASCL